MVAAVSTLHLGGIYRLQSRSITVKVDCSQGQGLLPEISVWVVVPRKFSGTTLNLETKLLNVPAYALSVKETRLAGCLGGGYP